MSVDEEAELRALGQKLAELQDAHGLADAVAEATLSAAREGLRTRRHRPGRHKATAGAASLLVAAAAVALVSRPVGLSVEGAAGVSSPRHGNDTGWVTAGEAPALARFSEGSTVRVEAGSSVRVLSRDARGAHLSVEQGSAEVYVKPGLLKRWQVEAGPFQVAVTGTRFRVEWSPVTAEARVEMSEGTVRVSSPCGPPRTLSAGEAASFRCETSERVMAAAPALSSEAPDDARTEPFRAPPRVDPVVTDLSPRTAPAPRRPSDRDAITAPTLPLPPPSARPTSTAEPPAPSASTVQAPVPSSDAPEAEPAWKPLLTRGAYAEALEALGPEGITRLLAQGSEHDVSLLADACRFSGRTDEAQRALSTLRRRFPTGNASRTAAFTLGRLALDKQNAPATAAIWFKKYLTESHGGAFAEEALGLLFQAEHRSGDRGLAVEHATQYLSLYPDGPYQRAAKAVIENP